MIAEVPTPDLSSPIKILWAIGGVMFTGLLLALRLIWKRMEDIETRERESVGKLMEVKTELGEVKGKLEGHTEARADIKAVMDLSADVLKELHEMATND